MVSLIVHAVLGVACIWFIVASNRAVFRRPRTGVAASTVEIVYYVIGAASVVIGWYFNVRFEIDYAASAVLNNPIWGNGSWAQYIRLMFVNPAASSASQDYTIGNVLLLPLMTIIDGRRRGIHRPWLFFVSSLFTSFAFAWAFYLGTLERQRRMTAAPAHDPSPASTAGIP